VNNVAILSLPSDKGSIDGYGAPDKFLEQVNFLFGRQTFTGGRYIGGTPGGGGYTAAVVGAGSAGIHLNIATGCLAWNLVQVVVSSSRQSHATAC
jgi:hypothetical protein